MMETFETLFGLFCLATVIYVLYRMSVSQKQALAEMKQDLRDDAASEPQVSNADAARLAKDFFRSIDGRAYRKFANYVFGNDGLPVKLQPETGKSMLFTGLGAILFGWGFLDGAASEGIIWNAIPVPGPIFQLVILALAVLCVWATWYFWQKRDARLTLERDAMTLTMAGTTFRLSYARFKLLVTPMQKSFTLQLMAADRKFKQVERILNMFPKKKVVPALTVKAIEYGNLYTAAGGEFS